MSCVRTFTETNISRNNRPVDCVFPQILVGFEHSQQFHVFELTRQLPKFSMFAISDNFDMDHLRSEPIDFDEHTSSYVSFRLNERFQRICLWINQVRYQHENKSIFFPNIGRID